MSAQINEPIAIVGSGCRFPGAVNSPSALWKLLKMPLDASQPIPPDRFDITGYYHPDANHHATTNVQHAYLLQEDLRVFDAAFFNISPNEAESMDPQQRLLLETVYEALEAGGHPLDALRGSDTAVYVGTMGVDYNDTLLRDLNTIPTYFATGTNRAIISNRISYFFDWHGPSMTIDTACSSSLIAVHQGVQALRTGESRVAVACGTQVILGPEVFIFESKMKMLSPTGRSRMWDENADGYARGEGVAAIVLKRLSDAIADGDHIECVIRGTGANQDGYSNGITVPSSDAQAALIRQTYARAGLNPDLPNDRPQFFEAHGTGTKAGDPKEAAAIAQCFGNRTDSESRLFVGSVKTIIGHTEGAAGLAGLLKGSAMVQEGIIPPNLLFTRLNPAIEEHYKGLQVPTSLNVWPELPEGVPRRVSVNSFGFGGSNAHAILEQYTGTQDLIQDIAATGPVPLIPFVFSAASEAVLVAQLQAYSKHLRKHTNLNLRDLAWTLQSRRTQLPFKTAFSAKSIEQLQSKIDEKLAELDKIPGASVGIRSVQQKSSEPRVLGVFTGQGAQWASMGAQLILSSEFVRNRVQDLQDSLTALPASDRPTWQLRDEMLAGSDTSRIAEAELSQPLCTAIQIILVDLLKAAGISFSAVVGHSSGEIAAAYAAGFISGHDAIRIAYYRGFHARLAGGSGTGRNGAMLAVGTSWEDAAELINLRAFKGRLAVAAHNSASSITLSGDIDAIVHAKKVFDEEKKFARLLQVDTAYHSHHMSPCGDPYIQSLRACSISTRSERDSNSCSWFSSVTPSAEGMSLTHDLQDAYWRDNMANTVLFADAIKHATANDPGLSYALEIGPHPALKGPAIQNMSDVRPAGLPYTGLLKRGVDDIEAFSDALGFIWSQCGAQAVDLQAIERTVSSSSASRPRVVVGLPSYQWNHNRVHWLESRRSKKVRGRSRPFHEVLGVLSPDSTARDWRWTNLLKVSEIPWLEGHQLQGQSVFPAAGYVAMALEAARNIATDQLVKSIEIEELSIPRAITFEDNENAGVETLVTLTGVTTLQGIMKADFSCYSGANNGTGQDLELMASASIKVVLDASDVSALHFAPLDVSQMSQVDADRFYSSLERLGYGYAGPFRSMSSLKRRLNQSAVLVDSYVSADDATSTYLVHPTWLDVAFQSSMLAYSAPGDERLWSLHVPTSIRSIKVNTQICASLPNSLTKIPVHSVVADGDGFSASIDLFDQGGKQTMVRVEDLAIKPFAPATKADDRRLFSSVKWGVGAPDGASVVGDVRPSVAEIELASICERISYYYLRKWKAEISDEDWTNGQPHHASLRAFMEHMLASASAGRHPTLKKQWSNDTTEQISRLISQHSEVVDVRLISAVGENIPAAVRGETTILEHMLPDNMLDDFYKKGLGFGVYNSFLAGMMKQLSHRYPHAKILEIGAGTGGATKSVLESMGNSMSSYMYTDVSVGFFEQAAKLFKTYNDRMSFKALDVEKSPMTQGFEEHSYDIIIASNVLHATSSLQKTLEHTRQLLKPGGYLMLLELTNNGPIRFSNIMGGLPGWWMGVDDGRKFAPTITPGEWHAVLRKTGFSGIDAITPELDVLPWPFSIMAAQAIDDRIQLLRRPLSYSSANSTIFVDNLVILGSGGLRSAQIAEDISEYLARFCGQITTLTGLPTEAEAHDLPPMSTFINLVDLDSPIFKSMSSDKMNGLKRIFELAKNLLWITQGAQTDEPYHMASIAFSRAMSHEAGHINISHLDLTGIDQNTSKAISEHLLRQCILDESRETRKNQKLLWSLEPEAVLDRGRLLVPRVIGNDEQNARLNASRRLMNSELSVETSLISISWDLDASPALTKELPTWSRSEDQRLTNVESSTLMALKVAEHTYLYLCANKDMVFFSERNSSRTVPLISVPIRVGQPIDTLLVALGGELLAGSLVQSLRSGSNLSVLITSHDHSFATALREQALEKAIGVTFICDADSEDELVDPSWTKLSSRAPRHINQKTLLAAKASHFLNLAPLSSIGLELVECLPPKCKTIAMSELCQEDCVAPFASDTQSLTKSLESAVSRASISEVAPGFNVPLKDIGKGAIPKQLTTIVQWPSSGEIEVNIRPLDPQCLFSADQTYLLVGLTGEIGRSICEWMISNGAGCVCLTSRQPKVSKSWIDSFKGAVKVFAMDITDRTALEEVVKAIRLECPPIAGVANGAMVLEDTMFSNMSLETMQKVLGPKIDGTNNLDEVFCNDDLDFFILFSSSACVIGNSGQSNYAAANGYLNSLSRQRRRRGLAASTLDIGRVAGIGYVETAGQAVMSQLNRFGLMAISESEFRHMFAETIRAGYPDPRDGTMTPDAVVTTGIRIIRDDEDIQGPWFDNPLFSHCIVPTQRAQNNIEQGGKKAAIPISEQLAQVTTRENALEVMIDCFIMKLRIILQLSDQDIDPDVPLVELGVDSLVAVEVRSWFLKELKVDIPVLKIVGGASPVELCERAVEKLPESAFSKKVSSESTAKTPQPISRGAYYSTTKSESSSVAVSASQSASGYSTPQSSTSASTQSSDRRAIPESKDQQSTNILKREQLSFGQSRFWFLRLLLEDQTTSNVAFYYHIAGHLRVGDLERAVRAVTARHEALRTRFVQDETEADKAFQEVLDRSTLKIEHKKIQSKEDVATEYAQLKEHIFDIENGDLMKLVLLSISPTSNYLLVNYHHILMDGVSFQVFLSDLEKAYNGQSLGPAPRQFSNYAAAQRQAFNAGEMEDELQYWREIFPIDAQPPVLPLLPMAKTSSRTLMKDFDVHQLVHRLSPALTSRIKLVSKAQRSTPFHFYLATFKTMLLSFTDANDLTIGIADANRNDGDVISSIGFFLNLLTLRFARCNEQTFAEAIVDSRKITYAALANSRLPFDILLKDFGVARSSTHSPFFQAFFDYRQGAQEKHSWGNCQFEFQELHPGRTAYDITLDVTDSSTDTLLMIRVQKGLYDLTAANLLMDTFVHFLEVLSDDPSMTISSMPLFSEKQLTQAVSIGSGPDMISDWPETLAHRIDQIAESRKSEISLLDGHGTVLTYSTMVDRIGAISEALHDAQIGPGARILVFQDAACDWVCSMLAIMRVGGIYVPLDLRNPASRLAAVSQDCDPKAILADATTFGKVSQLLVPNALTINVSTLNNKPLRSTFNHAQAQSPAAILYTSGSTGTPKGIVVTHAGLRNEIEGYTKAWNLGAERVLQQSSFTFNHSSDQIYTGLVNGGSVYVVPWSQRGDPLSITQIMQEQGISYTKATPSEYSLWMQYGGESLKQADQWRFAFGGGESLTNNITNEFADLGLQRLRLFNSYGPTEISISSTKMELDFRNKEALQDVRIACGYSLPNYAVYVVDEQMRPLPIGMPGELCIGGAGVSLGYLGNDGLTTQKFVTNTFASRHYLDNGWTRMYRTGDIGHLQPDGAMVFHNRIEGDTQVKIRGLRIDLSDVESNLISASRGALKEAVVDLRGDQSSSLIAYVTFSQEDNTADREAFLSDLLSELPLPQYMVPSIAIELQQVPLTNHSKVDRRALRDMPIAKRARAAQNDTSLSHTVLRLQQLWSEVLDNADTITDIRPSSDFFLVGGNSILIIRLQARIRQVFNVSIRLVDLLGASTLDQMAHKIEKSTVVDLIDWDRETTPPTVTVSSSVSGASSHKKQGSLHVLITGATGFLAKHIIPKLVENPLVDTIHCVAVRDKCPGSPRMLISSPKVVTYNGDLSLPLLGLSEAQFGSLSNDVDVILHLGASRSFWDNYTVLRDSNVNSTKALVRLALPRAIPICYISTIGVLPQHLSEDAHSAAAYHPPTDGTNGYTASRWASERILERSGLPTTIFRFLPPSAQSSTNKLLDRLVELVDLSRKIPDMSGWEGRIGLMPANEAADFLYESAVDAVLNGSTGFLHHQSPLALDVAEMRDHIEERRGAHGLQRMPGLQWIGLIKTLGFDYLLTTQDAIVTSHQVGEEGSRFESRR